MKLAEPKTREEWQTAVDVANALLLLDSARQYGLIKGGPEANLERCEEILKRGEALGVVPSPSSIDDFVAGLQAQATE